MNKQPYFNTYTFVSRVLITHNMVNQYLLIWTNVADNQTNAI